QHVEPQQPGGAHEAALLAHDREHEVGGVLGQVVEPGLGGARHALAGDAALADRDLGLGQVVPVALRVNLIGVQERREPVQLIGLQHLHPAPGKTEKISAIETTPARPSHTKWRHGAPCTNRMPTVIAPYTSAVPKSGSMNTSTAGSAT